MAFEQPSGGPFKQGRIDFWVAAGTTLLASILYLLTVQRTISFWDCGEFIACAAILGVPHPPGTPLFVLIGRLFSIIPFADDVSLRVNLVSVFSGALSVGVAYLVASRLLRRWLLWGMEFWGKEALILTGALCSAMLFGFAATVWNNHVEAEVYGITLAIFITIVYTALVWVDVRYTPLGPRLLIFATYMAVFGLGVHMMVYLAIPGMWLMVFLFHEQYRRDWRLWMGALATMLVMATGTEAFLWNLFFLLGIALFWRYAPRAQRQQLKGWIAPIWAVVLFILFQFTFPIAVMEPSNDAFLNRAFASIGWGGFEWMVSLVILLAAFVGGFLAINEDPGQSRRRWGILMGIVAAALTAFTLQIFIPIRSLQDPRIDENNPETWESFKGFLERKQYGQESMVERMFDRRGLWQNQFGRHPRMGFWGFFEEQFAVQGRPFFILFLVGLLPFVAPFVRSGAALRDRFPDRFAVILFLFITLLATTAGLVVYMNFADGVFYNPNATDQAYLEVRDRDYFFTTGFALFGLCIGLGLAWLTGFVAERFRALGAPVVALGGVLMAVVLPYGTVSANWFRCDRSDNYIPYDYAYNILQTCPENAILFTNGDNDTFPVWCLQEAYGFRRDVRVVNLSLVNTDWYILQMKNQYGVPMELEDDQIKTETARAPDGRLFGRPPKPFYDRFRGYEQYLVPYLNRDNNVVRVQDVMVEQIVLANGWKDPILFSGSYSGQTMLDLPRHLEAIGLNYRLVRATGAGMIDTAGSRHLYDSVYRYRSFADLDSYQDESAASLLWAYPEKLLQLAERYAAAGQAEAALELAEKAREVLPAYWRVYAYLARAYGNAGRTEDSTRVVDSGLAVLEKLRTVNPGNVLYVQSHALILDAVGRTSEALAVLTEAFQETPKEELIFVTLAQLAVRSQDQARIELAARLWLDGHPTDARAQQLRSMAAAQPRAPVLPPTQPALPGDS